MIRPIPKGKKEEKVHFYPIMESLFLLSILKPCFGNSDPKGF